MCNQDQVKEGMALLDKHVYAHYSEAGKFYEAFDLIQKHFKLIDHDVRELLRAIYISDGWCQACGRSKVREDKSLVVSCWHLDAIRPILAEVYGAEVAAVSDENCRNWFKKNSIAFKLLLTEYGTKLLTEMVENERSELVQYMDKRKLQKKEDEDEEEV